MTARRDFLRGLVSLPLIGGGVTLIGQPTAVAEAVTKGLLFEYGQWLAWEAVLLQEELHGGGSGQRGYLEQHAAYDVAQHLHGPGPRPELHTGQFAHRRSQAYRWKETASPASSRAALVLSTVGCDWRRWG